MLGHVWHIPSDQQILDITITTIIIVISSTLSGHFSVGTDRNLSISRSAQASASGSELLATVIVAVTLLYVISHPTLGEPVTG